MKREPGYLYIEYRADTKRYCIRTTAGDERISRYYADGSAAERHVERLRERGWRWAKEQEDDAAEEAEALRRQAANERAQADGREIPYPSEY